MRCIYCGHWNSCPRCNDYLCEVCGEELPVEETYEDIDDDNGYCD